MYYLGIVVGCTPTVKKFKTEDEVKVFLDQFVEKYGSLDDGGDNWVDYLYEGKKIKIDQLKK